MTKPILLVRTSRGFFGISHFITVLLLGAALVSCSSGPFEVVASGPTMGTTYTVKVVASTSLSRDTLREFPARVQAALDEVNAKMSTYQDDSELSRFNQHNATTSFPMSPETLEVIAMAQKVSEESQGAFDITVGPLVNAWGFGPDNRTLTGPSGEELAALRERVGYGMVYTDLAAKTIRKERGDVYCDLSAIAKGYGVDRVAIVLDNLGFQNYMIEVGGEMRTRGLNKAGQPWRIAIEKPVDNAREIQTVVGLSGKALATSGDYRNYYEIDGQRLSHTIDPRTGRPIDHILASVSVIHQSCALADAYATTLMVLGPEEGYQFAQTHNLTAYFIIRQASGSFAVKTTPADSSWQTEDR